MVLLDKKLATETRLVGFEREILRAIRSRPGKGTQTMQALVIFILSLQQKSSDNLSAEEINDAIRKLHRDLHDPVERCLDTHLDNLFSSLVEFKSLTSQDIQNVSRVLSSSLSFLNAYLIDDQDRQTLLEFLTKKDLTIRTNKPTSIAFNKFVSYLISDSIQSKDVLFCYSNGGFLPLNTAMVKPTSNITAIEPDETQRSILRLTCELFQLKNLNVSSSPWLETEPDSLSINSKFDLIISIPSFGSRPTTAFRTLSFYSEETRASANLSVYEIEQIFNCLSFKGEAYILLEPTVLYSQRNDLYELRSRLNKSEKIKRVIALPNGLFLGTHRAGYLLNLSNRKNQEIQFADPSKYFTQDRRTVELNLVGIEKFIRELRQGLEGNNTICNVKYCDIDQSTLDLDPKQYVDSSIAAQQLQNLLLNYKNYKEVELGSPEITNYIGVDRGTANIDPKNTVVCARNFREIKLLGEETPSQHYLLISVNPDILIAEYLVFFMKSELGQLIIQNCCQRTSMLPHVSTQALRRMKFPLPLIEDQRRAITANERVEKISAEIQSLSRKIITRPASMEKLLVRCDAILSSMNELTDADEALSLILNGETDRVEFKETLSLNVRRLENDPNSKPAKDKEIEKACLKTITGFLNSHGGNLFIGVRDDSKILGLGAEISKLHRGSIDRFLLHINNIIRERIQPDITALHQVSLINIDGQKIIRVKVSESPKAIFLGSDSEFYVRQNPATIQLKGPDMSTYMLDRFEN